MVSVDAVVFDLFETLVTEFDPQWCPRPSTGDRLGVPNDVFNDVWRSRHADRMTSDVDFRDVLREACSAAGTVIDRRLNQIIESLHTERLAAKAKPLLAAEPRVLDALGRLRDNGLKLGLLSNCSVEEVAAWDRSPFAPLFEQAVFSYRVGLAKPDRAAYAHTCRQLGVAPHRAIFVGDGGSDELAGAVAAGLAAYRARWFVDQWPVARRSRDTDRICRYPALMSPHDLVTSVLGMPP